MKKTILFFLLSFLLSFIICYKFINFFYEKNTSSKIRKMEQKVRPANHIISAIPKITPTAYRKTKENTWIGKVSHYSYAGCQGCSPDRRMANGEILSDFRPTIAFNWLPMNTRVLITNLHNGKSIEAIVTDTGGFNSLGRIADLTPVIYNYLETKTDVTDVKIEVLK